MHRTWFTIATLVSAACFTTGAAGQDASQWTAEATLQVKRISDVVPAPGGQRIAFLVAEPAMEGAESTWQAHIHVASGDGTGGYQLTRGEHSVSAPAWSPDGRWIGFLSSRSGTSSVWRIRVDGGEAEQITRTPGDVSAFQWSPSGAQIAYLMQDPLTEQERTAREERRDARVVGENPKMIGLYVVAVGSGGAPDAAGRRLSPAAVSVGAWSGQPFDWSPDGARIAFAHRPSPDVNSWPDADVSVVDVSTGQIHPLASTQAAESDPRYSPDGRLIAYSASDAPVTWGFTSDVYLVASGGGAPRPLARTLDRQAGIVGWARDGDAVLVHETHGTIDRLLRLPVGGDAPEMVSPDSLMVGAPRLDRSGTHLGFVSEASDRPPEAFASPVDDFEPVQVSDVQRLPDAPVGRTEVVTWTSTDGRRIEGLLTYPVHPSASGRVPLLVAIHGGPTGVFTQRFIGSASQYPIAVFAARGYAVLRPNPRGSSGYGREFRYANYGDWGGGDYQDILAGVDALVERGLADPDRLGVMGWSYGGYMTSWIITQTGRFRAASVGAGLPNLMSFAGTSDVPDFIPDYLGGEYWEHPERWQAHSPLFQVKNVRTPTLIQHGEADERVPVSQAYELYQALRRQGVPVSLVTYPRQPHGIREPKLLLDAMQRNLDWFDRWVLGDATPSLTQARPLRP